MSPQEREIINGIFDRLKQGENQIRDLEAEKLIADRLAEQPGAPYLLAQVVHVQEQALVGLHARVQALEAEIAQFKASTSQNDGASNLFGISSAPSQTGRWNAQAPQPQEQRGSWGMPANVGGSFLASALTTVAGIASGMVLGNVMANAFGLRDQGLSNEPGTNNPHTVANSAHPLPTQEASYHTSLDSDLADLSDSDDWI